MRSSVMEGMREQKNMIYNIYILYVNICRYVYIDQIRYRNIYSSQAFLFPRTFQVGDILQPGVPSAPAWFSCPRHMTFRKTVTSNAVAPQGESSIT